MKKRLLSFALTLALCLGLTVPAMAGFSDVPYDHWGNTAINYVVEKGLFSGTGNNTFSPDAPMTRAMLVQVLYSYAGSPSVSGTVESETPFRDIPADAYYANAVVWAYQNGIFPAWFLYSDSNRQDAAHAMTEFFPDSRTPRFDFARMLFNFSAAVLNDPHDGIVTPPYNTPFTDMEQTPLTEAFQGAYPNYASRTSDITDVFTALAWAYDSKIMSGTGDDTMSPAVDITRAHVAVMLMNCSKSYEAVATAQAFMDEVARLVNVEREKEGLPPLKSDNDKLNAAALVRANELIELFSHDRPDGRECFTAMDEAGVRYRAAGENIAAGQTTPAQVVDAWMNSPGHRANILERAYKYIGVGYVNSGSGYRHYWVQMFAG